jgi:hypothetical protein
VDRPRDSARATTPDSQSQQGGQQTGDQTVSMRQASMFLQFLLGGGA